MDSALTNRHEELIKFVVLTEYSLGCRFISDAMANCFPDIIGVVWIPLNQLGNKFLFSNLTSCCTSFINYLKAVQDSGSFVFFAFFRQSSLVFINPQMLSVTHGFGLALNWSTEMKYLSKYCSRSNA